MCAHLLLAAVVLFDKSTTNRYPFGGGGSADVLSCVQQKDMYRRDLVAKGARGGGTHDTIEAYLTMGNGTGVFATALGVGQRSNAEHFTFHSTFYCRCTLNR